jgi:hypothetical protein
MRSSLVLGCAVLLPLTALAGFRVSSVYDRGHNAHEFDAASAIDDKPETAWLLHPESEQIGEYIEIDLPKSTVDKVAVMVGWEKDDKAFRDYGRIKTARLELYSDTDDGPKRVYEKTLSFEDKRGLQVIDIDDTKVGSDLFGAKARMTITGVYPGADYPSVAVSEFRILLQEMDAPTVLDGDDPASVDGNDFGNAIDDNAKTFFVSESPTPSFAVVASGFGVSSIVITPGPKTYARPKTIEVTCADQTRTFTIKDDGKPQAFALPAIVGYSGSAWGAVKVTVKDSYPGQKPGVAIGAIKLKATNYDGF